MSILENALTERVIARNARRAELGTWARSALSTYYNFRLDKMEDADYQYDINSRVIQECHSKTALIEEILDIALPVMTTAPGELSFIASHGEYERRIVVGIQLPTDFNQIALHASDGRYLATLEIALFQNGELNIEVCNRRKKIRALSFHKGRSTFDHTAEKGGTIGVHVQAEDR